MKILIGQSYFRVLDPKELERQMPYPPLGALYAATILRNMGHEIIFYDGMLSRDPEDFIEKIISIGPDLLLIYDDEFNYLTKMCLSIMRDAVVWFIKFAHDLAIPSVVFSSDAVDYYKFYFDAGCDAIIYGEGEVTLQELVNSIMKINFISDRKNIDGIKYYENGKYHITPPRKMIDNLDTIPDPDYSFVNIEAYRKIWIDNHGYFSLNISTTRGCPYKCNWCAKPIYGKSHSARSPENVVRQIFDLKQKYAIDHYWITDDIFGLKPGWIEHFASECKKYGINLPFKCLSRPDLLLRNDTLALLKESGCKTIWIGAESGSQKILDNMEKGTTVDQIYETAVKTHQLDMEIAFFIQFGYIGEEWRDIKLTRKMIRKCMPEDIGISVSYPLPGTKFYSMVREQMMQKTNWTDSADLDMMFNGNFEKSFYKLLHCFVHTEYRLYTIIQKRKWKKLPYLVVYSLRYMKFWLKIALYLIQKTIPYKNLRPQVSGI
jgi:anaerobic magnesium-protoporphyrin IX monomethyl ester cyclase